MSQFENLKNCLTPACCLPVACLLADRAGGCEDLMNWWLGDLLLDTNILPL
jgi:hypothetical protein